jgi:alkaline phosphatase D
VDTRRRRPPNPLVTTPFTRRSLLAGAAGAGVVALTGNWRALGQSPTEVARGGAFTQSVASGQPATDAITLWTKLSQLERPGLIQYEVATDPDFRSVLARHSVPASADRDFAVTARLRSARLKPGEQYYYRFLTCDTASPVGRFRTLRPADSNEPVRIGFFSCQEWNSGFYTAHAALVEEQDLDAVVCLGDYVYEKNYYTDASPRTDTTGANRDGEVQTLAEYRDKYRLYHTDPNLLRVRETHSLLATWDDHEVEDNYAGDHEGDQSPVNRVPFAQRRANGYQAFFEHMPVVPSGTRVYGSTRLGRHAELFMLDQRQYRDDQPCGDPVVQPCAEADAAGRTMLGAEQKAWFLNGLAASGATWKLVGNPLMVMALEVAPRAASFTYDSWDGYKAERRELLDLIAARRIGGVSFLTGDIHTFFAGNVTPSGREGPGEPAAVATEFVGGAITSRGIADQYGEDGGSALSFPADAVVQANNPHIKFSNQQYKGYGVLEARANELLVQYRAPRTIATPRATSFTLARFRVARGAANVEVLS